MQLKITVDKTKQGSRQKKREDGKVKETKRK